MDGGAWWAAVHGVARSRTRLSDFTFTFHFHALEKEMATHSSVLAWRIPGMGEPSGLLSMGSHRVGHDWSNLAGAAAAAVLSFQPNIWCIGYISWQQIFSVFIYLWMSWIFLLFLKVTFLDAEIFIMLFFLTFRVCYYTFQIQNFCVAFYFIMHIFYFVAGDMCLIPGLGRSPGEGNGNPLGILA